MRYNENVKNFVIKTEYKDLELLLTATCRNPLSSPLFDLLSRVELLDQKINSHHKIDSLCIDHRIVDQVDRVLPVKKYSVIVVNESSALLSVLKNVFKSLYYVVHDFIWSRLLIRNKTPEGSIIYLDNFIFINSIDDKGSYSDRYYTDFSCYLSDDENHKIWYAPTLYSIKSFSNYIKLFTNINKSSTNFWKRYFF